ncbi:hypothetical protein EYZ49_12025 [Salmonella enterica subsp. salamae serovar 13,22:z:-]|uniref:hypothetical protein n=1 Tax=Salmonella enterica TaxID=28901 RepID=UPI0010341682|nr:hypothetical protein [Salmonella enterica]TBN99522.1 hypothetical protein EYZ49_12025 [Salmonella enterica subsp. salamae serovar 13,22:z:-]
MQEGDAVKLNTENILIGLAWLGLAWLGLAWLGIIVIFWLIKKDFHKKIINTTRNTTLMIYVFISNRQQQAIKNNVYLF